MQELPLREIFGFYAIVLLHTMKLIPVGLDMGSSGVKCLTISRKEYFPSVITTLKSGVWDDVHSKKNVTLGDDGVKSAKYYNSKCVFPISSGRPIDIAGYMLLAEHALKNIGISNASTAAPANNPKISDISDVCLVVGLPYNASPQIEQIQSVFNSKLKVAKCIIETQARGTLRSMNLTTGIIFNIGYGTTEAVIFDEGQAVAGNSLRCAVGTILEGLSQTNHTITKSSLTDVAMFKKFEKESRPYAAEIADEINLWYHEKILRAKQKYPVIVSGGGILNGTIHAALKKTDIPFVIPEDPLYSNVTGHFMRAQKNC